MEQVDKEVLKKAVEFVVETMKKINPKGFYDAGTIVGQYHILVSAQSDKPKKPTKITINDIQRELERMIKVGEISAERSWLDPEAVKQRKEREEAIDAKYSASPEAKSDWSSQ